MYISQRGEIKLILCLQLLKCTEVLNITIKIIFDTYMVYKHANNTFKVLQKFKLY